MAKAEGRDDVIACCVFGFPLKQSSVGIKLRTFMRSVVGSLHVLMMEEFHF